MTHSVAEESGEVVKGRTTANPGPGPEQGRAAGQGNRQVQSDQRQPSPGAAADWRPTQLRRLTPLQEDLPPVQQWALCVQHALVQRGRRLRGRLGRDSLQQ